MSADIVLFIYGLVLSSIGLGAITSELASRETHLIGSVAVGVGLLILWVVGKART